jgi:hypothetical protein
MKKLILLVMIVGLTAMGCANTSRYNTQRGAVIGAGLGALAGQAIGQNTAGTLIGTGVGTLLGTIVGNGMDQQADEYRYARDDDQYQQQQGENPYYGRYNGEETLSNRQPPPGRWVMVPGHWRGRHWVPSHEVWQPIDPR